MRASGKVVKAPLYHLQPVLADGLSLYAQGVVGNYCLRIFTVRIDMPLASNPKSVFVRQYTRFRFGRTEQVRQHWRSCPNQLTLF
ncbi:hypothetical protein C6Q17_37430 [Burkholderia contaminans]|nr:hypothetical protein C6Q17_37430 [Burkholderia contaminans]